MKAMKNYIARTFILTLLVVVVLLGLYFVPTPTVDGYTLRRVNMLADIEAEEPEEEPLDTVVLPPPVKPAFVDTCKTGLTCIEDYADSTQRGMKPFYEALDHADERPVRIAYFGDSFIEADILTGDLRDMLQARFGGCGVGYVDITSGTYGFRKTLRHSFAGWTSKGVNDSTGYDRKRIGPSGHYFIPHRGAYVEARPPKAHRGQLDSCEVATIYFEATATPARSQAKDKCRPSNAKASSRACAGPWKKLIRPRSTASPWTDARVSRWTTSACAAAAD